MELGTIENNYVHNIVFQHRETKYGLSFLFYFLDRF